MATTQNGFGEGPLDTSLMARYQVMFDAYALGGNSAVVKIHDRISEEQGTGAELRPDAALFLLVNADHMLIRPHTSSLSNVSWLPDPVESAVSVEHVDFEANVMEALSIILESMDEADEPRPRSSHAVMRAIEREWPKLAQFFSWA